MSAGRVHDVHFLAAQSLTPTQIGRRMRMSWATVAHCLDQEIDVREYTHEYEAPAVDPRWRERAACAGQDLAVFFPASLPRGRSRHARAAADAALRVCRRCPVVRECLADAMAAEGSRAASERAGIRGGLIPAERFALFREGLDEASVPGGVS